VRHETRSSSPLEFEIWELIRSPVDSTSATCIPVSLRTITTSHDTSLTLFQCKAPRRSSRSKNSFLSRNQSCVRPEASIGNVENLFNDDKDQFVTLQCFLAALIPNVFFSFNKGNTICSDRNLAATRLIGFAKMLSCTNSCTAEGMQWNVRFGENNFSEIFQTPTGISFYTLIANLQCLYLPAFL